MNNPIQKLHWTFDSNLFLAKVYFEEGNFLNVSKDRKTNFSLCMLQGKKEEQIADKWQDSFTRFVLFFLFFFFLLFFFSGYITPQGSAIQSFFSVLHIPVGSWSTKIPTIAPYRWLQLESAPFIWQHLDILKLHFHFLTR